MTERAIPRPQPQDTDPAIRSLRQTGVWYERRLFSSRKWKGTIPEGKSGITLADLNPEPQTSVESFAHSTVGEALLNLRAVT